MTIRIPDETKESLESEADEYGVSVSEYIRQLIEDGREYGELRDRLESREDRIDELEDQLAKRSNVEEKVDTLVARDQEPNAPFFVEWYRWFSG